MASKLASAEDSLQQPVMPPASVTQIWRRPKSSLAGQPMWINTVLRDEGLLGMLQMAVIRAVLIWPLRAVAPAAVIFWSSWMLGHPLSSGQPVRAVAGIRGALSMLFRRVGSRVLHGWFLTEIVFLGFYLLQKRRLSGQTTTPPKLPPGKALEMCRRALAVVEDIHGGGGIGRSPALSRQGSQHEDLNLGDQSPNVEKLLRLWDSADASSFGMDPIITLDEGDKTAQLRALKLAEISGWCQGAHPEDVRRGNIEEWVIWAFFNAPSKDALPQIQQIELDQLMQELDEWADFHFAEGYNPKVKAMRLTIDPIRAMHRPLIYYLVTAYTLPVVQNMFLSGLGFVQHKSGSLTYWRRPGLQRNGAETPPPMVFCHGIGVSVLPYVHMLEDIVQWNEFACQREIFLVSIPHIAMRIKEDCHSMSEMVSCISDMMVSWNVPAAHFVGHSFGTVVVTWMIKAAPERVLACTLMDPVCFLLVKPDVNYNFLYRRPDTPTRLLLSYFVASELYIAYSMTRNFFWYLNILWPEDIPKGVPALVVLSGKDSIVPAHSIRRFLAAYQKKHAQSGLEVIFNPHMGHGEQNFGAAGWEATGRIVEKMFAMERNLRKVA